MSKTRVLTLIEDLGPMTAREIAEHMRITPSYARACVSYCRNTLNKLYVTKYLREEVAGHLYPRAVYALKVTGEEPDAKRPKPLTKRDYNNRVRAKKRGRVSTVFELAVPVDKRRMTSRKRPDVRERHQQKSAVKG